MPKKTLALIAGLVLVTVILFIIALRTGNEQNQPGQQQIATPTVEVKHISLSLAPNLVQVVPASTGTMTVMMDNQGNNVTGISLDLLYDPTMVANVKITADKLFANSIVFANKNDPKTGKYVYTFALQPGQKAISASGAVATITFTAQGVLGKQSQLFIQPSSIVTAMGIGTSVMKEATGATVVIAAPTAAPKPSAAIKPAVSVTTQPPVTVAPTK